MRLINLLYSFTSNGCIYVSKTHLTTVRRYYRMTVEAAKATLPSSYVTALVNDRDAYPVHVAGDKNKKQIITVGQ